MKWEKNVPTYHYWLMKWDHSHKSAEKMLWSQIKVFYTFVTKFAHLIFRWALMPCLLRMCWKSCMTKLWCMKLQLHAFRGWQRYFHVHSEAVSILSTDPYFTSGIWMPKIKTLEVPSLWREILWLHVHMTNIITYILMYMDTYLYATYVKIDTEIQYKYGCQTSTSGRF